MAPMKKVDAVKTIVRVAMKSVLRSADAEKLGRACAALALDTTDTVQVALEGEYGGFLTSVRKGWGLEYEARQKKLMGKL